MKVLHRKFMMAAWLGVSAAQYASVASAEPSGIDKSLATQLFKEGRTLLDQGHYPDACRKLEESQRLDPGGGTLLNLALCHEKEGRTATAWTEFTEALGIAKKDDRPQRIEFARTHIAEIEPLLSRLVIQVPHAGDLPDLEVKRDGSAIGRAAWGSAMPVDPGDHVVEASAPGKTSWKQVVTVAPKSDTRTVVVPALESAPFAPATAQVSTSGIRPATGASGSSEAGRAGTDGGMVDTSPHGPSPSTWVALGIGAVATGAGAYFGLRAMSEKKDADRNCPNDVCNRDGARKNDDAIKSANFATVGFGVGVVGLGVGTFLLIRGLSSGRATPPLTETTRGPSSGKVAASTFTVSGVNAAIGRGSAELAVLGRW